MGGSYVKVHGPGDWWCDSREAWERWWAKTPLPLSGKDLADAQATIAAYADPDAGDEDDCQWCVVQVERLIPLVEAAEAASRDRLQ